jgi:Tol biopolymer transport system component
MKPLVNIVCVAVLIGAGAGCSESMPTQSVESMVTETNDGSGNKSANGNVTISVTEGTNLSFGLSPQGNNIAMSVQGVLFILPATGGSATAITDYYQDVREPVWSPDNTTITYYGYANGNWDLWSIPVSGGDPKALTSDPFDDREPHYSPDGSQIAFSSDRGGNYDIWILNLTDGELTQVTQSPADEYSPAWSPDGEQLIYAVTKNRTESEIQLVDVTGSTSRTVIVENGVVNGVSWHPDGNRVSYQLLGDSKTSMRSIALDGENAEVVSQDNDDVFPFEAHWANDNTVFYAANGKIYQQTIDADRRDVEFTVKFALQRPAYARKRRDHDADSEQKALGIAMPVLSPNGEWVAFSALGDIWMWHPGNQTLNNITDNHFVAYSPQWSPDGQQIAYISDKPVDKSTKSRVGLWIYDVKHQASKHIKVSAEGISGPSWSPDGKSVALFTTIPTNPIAGQMVIADLRDGSVTPVQKPVPAQNISWSADGAYLATTVLAPYSKRYREGVYQLVVTTPDGKEQYKIEPVAHRNMTYAVLTPSGRAMSYVQDGLLWQQQLNEVFEPQGAPRALTKTLADTPAWSGDGRFVVYMDANKMFKLDVKSGVATDITPSLTWTPFKPKGTWTLLVGKLFDGVSPGYLNNVLLTIEDNRILSMEPNSEGASPDIDASDKAAFPGLFEMHAHMGMNSESQGRTWLAYGVTSVRDPGAHPYVAKERQEMWNSGRSIGPRTHTTGFLTDGNRVYYSVAEGITSDAHLERALDRAKRLELDFIKTYVRLPDHWQKRVVEFAHGIGIPTSSHELFPAVAHGMDHVEHIGGTSRRGFAPKVSRLGRSYNDVVNLLAGSGMGITPTAVLPGYVVIAQNQPDLFSTKQFDAFYGDAGRQAAGLMSQMFGPGAASTVAANGQLLRDLNATDALMVSGTDSPFSPFGAGLHAELRLYALAGLSPRDVLRAATVKAAIAAGVENDLGTLEVGKVADIVIVDGDPLADIRDADNVFMTVKGGKGYSLSELILDELSL